MPSAVVDSSFMYALAAPNDDNYRTALSFAETVTLQFVIPVVALTEVTYLLRTRISHRAEAMFLRSLAHSDVQLESLTLADVQRSSEIMTEYADARFDFVDCCIMALTERLNVTRVLTFDRRDFPIFRPTHCDFLELLP